MKSRRENLIRLQFSFLAACVLIYMTTEYLEYSIQRKSKFAPFIAIMCLGLGLMEANKVGKRTENILGLPSE